jgi:5-(carboxyamino)imidazole ribonucleotide mutase
MPRGIPVATVAINGAANAAILALEMLSIDSGDVGTRARGSLKRFREEMRSKAQDQRLPLDC